MVALTTQHNDFLRRSNTLFTGTVNVEPPVHNLTRNCVGGVRTVRCDTAPSYTFVL
jgi:hypothetical protein